MRPSDQSPKRPAAHVLRVPPWSWRHPAFRAVVVSCLVTLLVVPMAVFGFQDAGIVAVGDSPQEADRSTQSGAATQSGEAVQSDAAAQRGEIAQSDAAAQPGEITQSDEVATSDAQEHVVVAGADDVDDEPDPVGMPAPAAAGDYQDIGEFDPDTPDAPPVTGETMRIVARYKTTKEWLGDSHHGGANGNLQGLRVGAFRLHVKTVDGVQHKWMNWEEPVATCTFERGADSCELVVPKLGRTYKLRHLTSARGSEAWPDGGVDAYDPRVASEYRDDWEDKLAVKKDRDAWHFPDARYLDNAGVVNDLPHPNYGVFARLRNPELKVPRCEQGLRLAVIVDTSDSIGRYLADYRRGLKQIISRMATAGNDTYLSFLTFASTSPAANPSNYWHANRLEAAGAVAERRALDAWVDNIRLSTFDKCGASDQRCKDTAKHYTNWDHPFGLVAEAVPQQHYDAVLMLTDGAPNRHVKSRSGTTITHPEKPGRQHPQDTAITANWIKSQGVPVYIGRMDSDDDTSIKERMAMFSSWMTGSRVYRPGMTLGEFDYTPILSYQDLAATIGGFFDTFFDCGITVDVDKTERTIATDGGVTETPGEGWAFGLGASGPGVIAGGGTRTTDAEGRVSFSVRTRSDSADIALGLSETLRGGFAPEGVPVCHHVPATGADPVPLDVVPQVVGGSPPAWTLGKGGTTDAIRFHHGDTVACTVVNARTVTPRLSLHKRLLAPEGGVLPQPVPESWELTMTSTAGRPILSGPSGTADMDSPKPGRYLLEERYAPDDGLDNGYRQKGWVCTSTPPNGTPEPLTLHHDPNIGVFVEVGARHADTTVSCAVTNEASEVAVLKEVSGPSTEDIPPHTWDMTLTALDGKTPARRHAGARERSPRTSHLVEPDVELRVGEKPAAGAAAPDGLVGSVWEWVGSIEGCADIPEDPLGTSDCWVRRSDTAEWSFTPVAGRAHLFKIVNASDSPPFVPTGPDLPLTGGVSRTAFHIAGGVLVLGGLALVGVRTWGSSAWSTRFGRFASW